MNVSINEIKEIGAQHAILLSDETPPRADKDKKPIEELLEKKQRNRILELIIASFGVIMGVVLGLWILIEIVMLGISK